jgi:glucokinase
MDFLDKTNCTAFSSNARLLADIGATHARFALETSLGNFTQIRNLSCDDYSGVEPLLRAYLEENRTITVRHAAFAFANPVEGDLVSMTNRDWVFSIEALRKEFGLQTLLVVNGFAALAMSLPGLQDKDLIKIAGGTAVPKSVIGILGPGTGLGVAALVPTSDGFVTLSSEGGHVNFSPSDERDFAICQSRVATCFRRTNYFRPRPGINLPCAGQPQRPEQAWA